MKIDHLGIAVRSIDEALGLYDEALGLECVHRETVVGDGVKVALVPVGESRIEVLEPVTPDTPVGRFLEKRGEGLHHICLEVDNLAETLARLKRVGRRLIDETPRIGVGKKKIAFVHPSSCHGVLLELSERAKD